MKTLPVQQTAEFETKVKGLLHDSESVCVVFTKKDGTQREMFCTLQEGKIPAEKQPKTKESNSTSSGSALRVFDTQLQEWRSFRWDSITEVRYV